MLRWHTYFCSTVGWMAMTMNLAAWDYPYHRMANQLALASLPPAFPAFVHSPANAERIAFLSGEPDRWRNTPENTFKHANGPDHYFDLEDLALMGLEPKTLSPFRHEFTAQLAAARARHAKELSPVPPTQNRDRTRELAGYLPWTITEYYAKLKSAFSALREFEALGTPEEVENTRQNILYVMGVMGHFVADATQPLHTTKHFNGWVGPNPEQYTTNRNFHQKIDGDFLDQVGLELAPLRSRVSPAQSLRPAGPGADELFPEVMDFILRANQQVEPLYRLEKEGKFSGTATGLEAKTGREYLAGQLVEAGRMLGCLWLTAWQNAPEDSFLRKKLQARKAAIPGEKPDPK